MTLICNARLFCIDIHFLIHYSSRLELLLSSRAKTFVAPVMTYLFVIMVLINFPVYFWMFLFSNTYSLFWVLEKKIKNTVQIAMTLQENTIQPTVTTNANGMGKKTYNRTQSAVSNASKPQSLSRRDPNILRFRNALLDA